VGTSKGATPVIRKAARLPFKS